MPTSKLFTSSGLAAAQNGQQVNSIRQSQLWEDLCSNPWNWFDNRLEKKSPSHPDFRHRVCSHVLWLNSWHKPQWLDSLLPSLHEGFAQAHAFSQEICRLCGSGQLPAALGLLASQGDCRFAHSITVYLCLLRACCQYRSLTHTKQVQALLSQQYPQPLSLLADHLVAALARCGAFDDARCLLLSLPHRSVYSWNALISGCAASRRGREALDMYHCMQADGVDADQYTFVSLFKVCSLVPYFNEAEKLHADAKRKGFTADVFVGSTLISMYGKCGSLNRAEIVYQELAERNTVSWNAMASVYAELGQGEKVLRLYAQMHEEGATPNEQTFVIAFQACGILAGKEEAMEKLALHTGQSLHADAQSKGFSASCLVANTVISMYGKCRSIVEAENLFSRLSESDAVSWNVMISAYVDCKQGNKALHLYMQMQGEGLSPDQQTYIAVLQACAVVVGSGKDMIDERQIQVIVLEIGRALHKDIQSKASFPDVFVSNSLISMYAKCGDVWQAENVFIGLSERDIVSWNAMLSAYAEQFQSKKALLLYVQLQEEDVGGPNQQTFVIALQACARILKEEDANTKTYLLGCLAVGHALHASILKAGFVIDAFIGSALLGFYGKCKRIMEAETVFNMLLEHDIVSWSMMLSAYVECGQGEEALQLFKQMQDEGVSPDQQTFVVALQACDALAGKKRKQSQVMPIETGRALHDDAWKKGFLADAVVGSALIMMYHKCECILEAESLFGELSKRDVVSWTVMLSAYLEQGQGDKALWLFRQMKEEALSPNQQVYAITLQACAFLVGGDELEALIAEEAPQQVLVLEIGRALHADALKDFYSNMSISICALAMYAKCGSIVEAENVFDGPGGGNTAMWNSLFSAYIQQGQPRKALQMYWQMQVEGCSPDAQTFVIALQACASLLENEEPLVEKCPCPAQTLALKLGQALHVDAWWKGFTTDIFVGNTLISIYGKHGSIVEAEKVFNGLCMRNVVSWNVMLVACTEQGQGEKALRLYRQMREENVSPDEQTLVTALQACGMLTDIEAASNEERRQTQGALLEIGQALHADSWRMGFGLDVCVGSSLLCMYGKCGSIVDAEKVFNGMPERNVVFWNSMLSAYIECGQGEDVLRHYRKMKELGIALNDITLTFTLEACVMTGSVATCKQLHFDVIAAGYEHYPLLVRALIRAYSGASCMVDAQAVFDGIPQRDAMSYTSCIAGYALEGNVVTSLQMFKDMQSMDILANGSTFLSLLCACSRTGLVSKGVQLFESMTQDYGIAPNLKHFIAVVDLLGRAGEFKRVEDFLLRMPIEADWAMWMCVLGACCTYGNIELGKRAFDRAVALKPKEGAAYVFMSNIYASAGMQKEVENLKERAWGYEDYWADGEQDTDSCLSSW